MPFPFSFHRLLSRICYVNSLFRYEWVSNNSRFTDTNWGIALASNDVGNVFRRDIIPKFQQNIHGRVAPHRIAQNTVIRKVSQLQDAWTSEVVFVCVTFSGLTEYPWIDADIWQPSARTCLFKGISVEFIYSMCYLKCKVEESKAINRWQELLVLCSCTQRLL